MPYLRQQKITKYFLLIFFVACACAAAKEPFSYQEGTITIDLRHPTKIPDLTMAFGGGVDGHSSGECKKMLSPRNIETMLSAGLKPLSYRLRTELGIEAWHWNPVGTWSDEEHQQGYWTSSTTAPHGISKSYGYRLPRRGNTLDEANDDGYSRLDDGDPSTFWKSNPYLSSHYTGEPDNQHPQWAVLDFGKPILINASRLHWGEPYAAHYRVQYALGGAVYFGHHRAWHDFPRGKITQGKGGDAFLCLGQPTSWGRPLPVRFIRILMTKSSGTTPKGSRDQRDSMGYALHEIEVGAIMPHGIFQDQVVHRPDTNQTLIYTSSTDPWHRVIDRDEKTEQPGLDFIMHSHLANQLPLLLAVPILYDTPENAEAEALYIRKHTPQPSEKQPWLELGEEPDGQRVDPNDVAALYRQVAQKIHAVYPNVCIGGLSFVTIDVDPGDTTYRFDHRPWLQRFLRQLRKHHQQNDFQFLTFEWYPFDDLLLPSVPLLLKQPARFSKAVTRIRHGGIPASMPLMISEYGYSVFAGQPEVEMAAALLNAECAAQFLLLGGKTSYLYGYEPNTLECAFGNSWGNLMMLLQPSDKEKKCTRLPTYYAAQLVTQHWGSASGGPCEVYPARSRLMAPTGNPWVTAYFFHQAAGHDALLLINKNPHQGYRLHCRFQQPDKTIAASWRAPFDDYSYSSAQYQWRANGPHGYPSRNQPPEHHVLNMQEWSAQKNSFTIAPWSITVLCRK